MAIDISEYLRVVKNGTTVNEVRTGIGGAVGALKTYFNADDIDQELCEIEHGIYGRDIRSAIYSALDKLSKKEGGGTPVAIYNSKLKFGVCEGFITDDWEVEDGN